MPAVASDAVEKPQIASPICSAPAPVPREASSEPAKSDDGICALVEYGYDANPAKPSKTNEISLVEGEVIKQIYKVDENWRIGTNSKGQRGLYPSFYTVEKEGGASAPVTPAVSRKPTATASYTYRPVEEYELGFPSGAKITAIVSQVIKLLTLLRFIQN